MHALYYGNDKGTFFFSRNLEFRWRQQTKCNEVYKCETEAHKGLGHEMEGGLSHCKA